MTFLFYSWIFFVVCQFLFWGILFNKQLVFTKQVIKKELPSVSIIICARNEVSNLQKYLPSILEQDYPDYEVWVIDDASTDRTREVLTGLATKHSNLHIHSIATKASKGKKAALQKGIELAQYEWLLLTDADCKPSSNQWIKSMQAATTPDTQIVLGYGPNYSHPVLVSQWSSFETSYTAIQYLSLAAWGSPYMGVGRNLMYKKELFLQNNGFQKHQHLASGDDDLFVNKVANSINTNICISPKSFVYSEPKQTWGALYQQKTRHYSTATSYRLVHQVLLILLSLSHFGYILLSIALLVLGCYPLYILGTYLLRLLLLYIVWNNWLNIFNNKKLLKLLWFFDIFIVLYYIVMAPALFRSNPSINWKE
ncbi:MAG: glycosyltransferase [Aureispira sp.]|nr:glycosyltransferase [Aureispira sp.]